VAVAGLLLASRPLVGCSDDETGVAPTTTTPTTTTTTTTAPPTTPTFVSGDPGAGPAVYLRSRATASGLSLEVVGRALPSVYGLAFRLQFDPGVLLPVAFGASQAWGQNVLAVSREPAAGLLVVGVSERGSAAGFAAADDVLAVLDFQFGVAVPATIDFVEGEGAVVQADGRELGAVSWVGGAIELR
jgi:hypothetical protein